MPLSAREKGARYRAKNRAKLNLKQREYAARNQEKIHAKQTSPEGRAYFRAYARKRRERFPESAALATKRYRERHPGRVQELEKRRYENNPEPIRLTARLSAAKRRAEKRRAPRNDLTRAQWLMIQQRQDHRCAYCGKRCKGKLTQDHITPLAFGGSHTLHNVIGACKSCNSRKHVGPPPVPVQPLLL